MTELPVDFPSDHDSYQLSRANSPLSCARSGFKCNGSSVEWPHALPRRCRKLFFPPLLTLPSTATLPLYSRSLTVSPFRKATSALLLDGSLHSDQIFLNNFSSWFPCKQNRTSKAKNKTYKNLYANKHEYGWGENIMHRVIGCVIAAGKRLSRSLHRGRVVAVRRGRG